MTLGFPCFYDYPPPRGASRLFPGRPPLAKSVIGARPFAGLSQGSRVGRGWRHREARETKWRSGVAATAVVRVFCNLNVSKDLFGHHSFLPEEHYLHIYIHPIGLVTGCTNIHCNWQQVCVRHLMLVLLFIMYRI